MVPKDRDNDQNWVLVIAISSDNPLEEFSGVDISMTTEYVLR